MGGSAGASRSAISDNVSGNRVIGNSLASQVSTIGRPSQTQETAESDTEGSDSETEAEADTPAPKTLRSKNLAGKRKRPSHNSPIAGGILETLMDRQEKADKAKTDEKLRIAREHNQIERQRASTDFKRADTDEKRARLDLMWFEIEKQAVMTSTWKESHEVLGKWYDRISASQPELSPEECLKLAENLVNSHPMPRPGFDRRSAAGAASQPRRDDRRRSPTPEGASLQLSSPTSRSF